MDDIGVPLFRALPKVNHMLEEKGIRDRMKLVASGKLINAGKQFVAMSQGADAIYTARGFMLAMGCIQALHCNENSCPVGITTHDRRLLRGLHIEHKADRVENYIHKLWSDHVEMLAAIGKTRHKDLSEDNLFVPTYF